MPPEIKLFDAFGVEVSLPKAPPTTSQSEVGRVQDRWSSKELRDITPETIARVAKNTAPLAEHMALCDKIYTDAHFGAIAEDRVSSVAGREWDIQPFTDAPGADVKPDDRKTADVVAQALYRIDDLEAYFEQLAWGDGLYPMMAAETIFDADTWLPVRFELPDAVRFNWDDRSNTPRILTAANPREGEPLKGGTWTTHSRRPSNPRKSRMHKALAWCYMLTRWAEIDWLAYTEKYGKPIPVAFFKDPNDKPSLIEAVLQIGQDFAGVLPDSTRLELKEALAGKKDVFEALAQFGFDKATKLVCGHKLIVDAQPGSGTLAGEGAQLTNLKITRAVCKRVAASVRHGLIRVIVWLHRGPKHLNRLPVLQFKTNPPEDDEKKARTYKAWHEVLEPSGLMIDTQHIQEVAGVPELVPRPTSGAAPSGEALAQQRETLKDLAAGYIVREAAITILTRAGVPLEEATATVDATLKAKPKVPPAATPPDPGADREDDDEQPTSQKDRRRASQKDEPVIRTVSDVIAAATLIGTKAAKDHTSKILTLAREAAESGQTLEEFRNRMFELYDEFETQAHAELTAQAMALGATIGAGDESERAGR